MWNKMLFLSLFLLFLATANAFPVPSQRYMASRVVKVSYKRPLAVLLSTLPSSSPPIANIPSNSTCETVLSPLGMIDRWGLSLLDNAESVEQRFLDSSSSSTTTTSKKLLLQVQACFLYTAYILYRSFRACFVTTFPRIIRKRFYPQCIQIVDPDPFGGTKSSTSTNFPTQLTALTLSLVLAMSCGIRGAVRVCSHMLQVFCTRRRPLPALAAGAAALVENERLLLERYCVDNET